MAFVSTTTGNDVIAPFSTTTGSFTTSGADTVMGDRGNDLIEAGDGDDFVIESFGNDTLRGDGGNDTLVGGNGRDLLIGGTGDDQLGGGHGDDTLLGGEGADRLFGNNGTNLLTGGAGADLFGFGFTGYRLPELSIATDFTLGEDRLDVTGIPATSLETVEFLRGATAAGDFSISITTAGITQTLVLAGIAADIDLAALDPVLYTVTGPVVAAGSAAADDLFGALGDDRLVGRGGDDRLFGQEGNDTLRGGAGDDLLVGGAGFDVLFGDAGDDTLIGGERMTGGAGADLFRLHRDTDSASILDFTHGEDRIDLSEIDADLIRDGHQDFVFIGSARLGAVGQLRLQGDALRADRDGDGLADFRITLQPGAVFDATDLFG